jgi:hypothetical protein
MAFQTSVATNPSPGIEGGFAGVNPNFSLITPDEGMWIAGAVGPVIGRMAWANTANGKVTSAHPGVATVRTAATGSAATATGVTVSMNNSVNITAVAGGTLVPGQPVSGTGIPAGAYVVSVSGTTAVLSAATTGGSATGVAVTQTTDFETAFTVRSTAGNGELAKISVRG